MLVMIIMLVSALPLFIIGLFIRKGKGLMLLAGYNTMSKAKRDAVDKEALSKTAGNLILRMSLMLALLGVPIYFEMTWAIALLTILFIADPCITAVRLHRKKPNGEGEKMPEGRKIIVVVITALVIIGVGIMIYNGQQEPLVSIANNHIEIKSMYGESVGFSDVSNISLIEKSMRELRPGRRTNGYGFGSTAKGNFESEELGRTLLFVSLDSAPTIRIERKEAKDIYISFGDEEKTRELFELIVENALPI